MAKVIQWNQRKKKEAPRAPMDAARVPIDLTDTIRMLHQHITESLCPKLL
jgi:hypothetical protein